MLSLDFCEALLGMCEDGNDLLESYAGKPLEELINGGACFQVFEECSYGHASSTKDPRATYFVFGTFDFQTIGPIQHTGHDKLHFRQSARASWHRRFRSVRSQWITFRLSPQREALMILNAKDAKDFAEKAEEKFGVRQGRL